MATFESKLTEMLIERGMFEQQATEVMQRVKTDKASEAMKGRWNDDVSGYPEQLLHVAWYDVKQHALAWIDENAPQA